jgi:vacuole morphology and inheritance protein 14
MDPAVQRALNDKLYDKRKVGALELERLIRDLVAQKDYPRVEAVLDQLCNDFAYAVHQPHARNGGLIGLAAAAIALGSCLLLSRLGAR